jgi:molybdopterin-guanine dinucleotide biosynthesis protein A
MMCRADIPRTAGLLLPGGRSSRFGAEKALALLHGQSLFGRASRPLRHLPIWAVSAVPSGEVAAYAGAHGVVVVPDGIGAPEGPLSGILAGLQWAHGGGFEWLASVPCDAPLLPDDLVMALLAARGVARAAYAETKAGPHPLCAVWNVELAAELAQRLDQGAHRSVRGFLAHADAAPVWFDTHEEFVNVNTREVLADLERRL